MAAIDQAVLQLQGELAQTRAQLQRFAQAHDELRTAHEALRQAAENANSVRMAEIQASENKLKQLLFNQKFDLLDMKTLQPEAFHGKQTEAFKPWARRVKAFCNAKRPGFRAALEQAEKKKEEIHSAASDLQWDHSETADEKLHDFLLQLCAGEAQWLVDTPALRGRGFEAWRLLTARYSPCGGQYELDAMLALLQRKAVSSAASIPGAISKMERDIEQYTERTGRPVPEEWKVPTLLQLLPKQHAETLKLRYAEGLTEYRTIVANLMTYAQTQRFEGAYGRGDNDMDIGALDQAFEDVWEQLPDDQKMQFMQAVWAGAEGEDPAPPPVHGEERFVDALVRKGKSKGKGKRQGFMTAA